MSYKVFGITSLFSDASRNLNWAYRKIDTSTILPEGRKFGFISGKFTGVCMIDRSLLFLLSFLFRSLLVSEKEAEEVLLLPNINELEDWENPILPRESELELQKYRADSEVFLYFLNLHVVFYLCLRLDSKIVILTSLTV